MKPVATTECSTALPLVSITIGALLTIASGGLLLFHAATPDAAAHYHYSTAGSLVLFMAGGIYLLACLVRNTTWRAWQQRIAASTLVAGAALFSYWNWRGYLPMQITLPPPNTLIALMLLGVAALLQPAARSLSRHALVFLLILASATLAIFGIIALILDYDPFFPWYGVHHMSLMSAVGLLMLCGGLAYSAWWCNRTKVYDVVSGITLLAALILLFSSLLGAGLIYTVSATHLHFETRLDLSNLLSERSARIVDTLHQADAYAAILAHDALQHDGTLWTQPFASDFALRITDQNRRTLRTQNAHWFDREAVTTIDGEHSQLWRDEEGNCQLRVDHHYANRRIEIGVPIKLQPLLAGFQEIAGEEALKLCARQPGGSLLCIAPVGMTQHSNQVVLAGNLLPPTTGEHTKLYFRNDVIQAVMPLPEYDLLVLMEMDRQAILGPLHMRLSLALPLAVLLLLASIALIVWRIHPLARNMQRSEHLYHSLVDGAADAIFLHDGERRFLEANPAAVTLLGYPLAQLIGMHPDDFLLPKEQPDALAQLEGLRQHGTPINTRRLLQRQDGSLVPVEIRATRLDSGQIISVVRDISEQMRHEETLQEKERFTRAVVEVLAEGVVVHDSDGAIIYTNQAALRILGQERELIDHKVTSFDPRWAVIKEDGSQLPPSEHPAMISLRQGLSKRDVILGVLRPDGERVWISVNSAPLWNSDRDAIIGAVASFSDVTQKQQMEQEIYHSRERLRALSTHLLQVREEEKALIARDIHDELGSSLTAIKMGIEWLNERSPDEHPEFRQRLDHLTKVTAQAILSTRRLVTQLRPTVLEDLGLWAALEWLLRELSKSSDIEVGYTLQCPNVEIPPNISLTLYRVVQEVLNNVAKHSRARKVTCECWEDDGILNILVEDDGIGIDEESTLNISSYGIRGMYERIGQIHGTLQLLGSPGEGTLVAISVPFRWHIEEKHHD